ncbi:hypothetical protein GCM10009117_03530 [Gangjinia marincola]|uniref:Secretion system C-terminal sorting domain-containing protein n=1 Tax=Gangjinia marincola TaxID=578463 RepID=A0ABN1MDP6_9FLAO
MKNTLFNTIAILSITCSIHAQHTFSIVAVDPDTGEIGSAGATCLGQEDGALAISDIVLGIGAIHTQSFYIPANQNNARTRMEMGDSPQEIIDWLIANDVQGNPSTRQYNIVDLNDSNPRSAAFTGVNCSEEFLHITGPNYAIAGNILISQDVVTDMETAFLAADGTLADKLIAAMQGAKRPGADVRCLDAGISSASAFIRVADPSDQDSSYGNLSLDLNVWITTEIFEPIDVLQDAYDQTLSLEDNKLTKTILSSNPVQSELSVNSGQRVFNGFTIFDMNGKIVLQQKFNAPKNRLSLNVDFLNSGMYFLKLISDKSKNEHIRFMKK